MHWLPRLRACALSGSQQGRGGSGLFLGIDHKRGATTVHSPLLSSHHAIAVNSFTPPVLLLL